jgi:hypothetical protein
VSPVTWDSLRHEPHQTPREGFLERAALELLPFRAIQRHHPAGYPHGVTVDVPPAIAAAMGDRRSQRILQGAAFEGQIDVGSPCGVMREGAGGTHRVIRWRNRAVDGARQRCTIDQGASHPSQTAPMTARGTARASAA